MADRRLELVATPFAARGGTISAWVRGENLPDVVVELNAPDTVVISQPHSQLLGTGTFSEQIDWRVEHVQEGTASIVEITVSAEDLVQKALCRVTG